MSIQNKLNAALYSRLSGGTALLGMLSAGTPIYFMQIPDDSTASSYVVFSYQADGDENLVPSRMKNEVLNIRAITDVGPAMAGSIDAQIDALLHLKPLTVTGWNNFWLARESGFQMVDNDAGKKYWTSGALYRIRLSN